MAHHESKQGVAGRGSLWVVPQVRRIKGSIEVTVFRENGKENGSYYLGFRAVPQNYTPILVPPNVRCRRVNCNP